MDILHKIIAICGGKKLLALVTGIVLWIVYHKTGVTAADVNTAVQGAQQISNAPDVNTLLQLIGAYIVGQSAADGLSGGKTSSAAVLANMKQAQGTVVATQDI